MVIQLVIGLGNQGARYIQTYHNAGLSFIEYAHEHANPENTASLRFLASDVSMNVSGVFAARTLAQYRITPQKLLIVHDDSDIALGSYRFAFNRGSAGHHGVESVQKILGTKRFWRLRIGVRQPQKTATGSAFPRAKAGTFVLRRMSAAHHALLETVFKEALAKIPAIRARTSL